jgi:hypothetical protein
MEEKPLSSDPEQRANDNRASREQSGLPPEEASTDTPTQSTRPKNADSAAQRNGRSVADRGTDVA